MNTDSLDFLLRDWLEASARTFENRPEAQTRLIKFLGRLENDTDFTPEWIQDVFVAEMSQDENELGYHLKLWLETAEREGVRSELSRSTLAEFRQRIMLPNTPFGMEWINATLKK